MALAITWGFLPLRISDKISVSIKVLFFNINLLFFRVYVLTYLQLVDQLIPHHLTICQ
jgi:hypothetical protein